MTQIVRDWRFALRERKGAALMILTEITRNGASLGALRRHGSLVPPLPDARQTIWEANGRTLLYGADLERAGRIERAYSTVGEIGALIEDPAAFTTGTDAALVDQALEEVYAAMRDLSRLAGLPAAEADRRVRALRDMTSGEGPGGATAAPARP